MTDNNQSSWIYEVNVKVDRSIEEEYRGVVEHHMKVITELPGFLGARRFEEHGGSSDKQVAWVIQYSAVDYEAIDNYFKTLAPTLRLDTTKFGALVEATRRVLKPAN
mmetsp:Transcript_1271/g.1328  ORF Transcript_1271/g.1328 Transcript_1271/m.1328 type:complete len:107 (+) Transcript_1271:79-399(+)|eukprot:gene140-146_t